MKYAIESKPGHTLGRLVAGPNPVTADTRCAHNVLRISSDSMVKWNNHTASGSVHHIVIVDKHVR